MAKLTPKQELFCQEYLKDLNGTQAYKRAGYKVKNDKVAQTQSSRLLSNVMISSRVKELMDIRAEENKINNDWVIKQLINVVEKSSQIKPVMIWNPDTKQMEESGEYEYDSNGVNKALELIGKHIGTFDPKHTTIKLSAEKNLLMQDQQLEKAKVETNILKAKLKLIEGGEDDLSLLEALLDVVKGGK